HRFQSDHGCPPFAKSSDDDRKIIVSKKTNENHDVDTRKFADQRQKFEQKNKKRDSITSKVALMKLKQTALGDKNFPEEERLYFYVDLPKNAKFSVLAVCFSKEWSIGKCIDVIVKLGEIPLENPQNNQKLKLFAKIEQEYRFLSPDDCLIKLIDSDLISNAITLYAFYF
uniref:ZFAND1-like ubiquitin-like domain-containing protein n=1 Tax=Romanomermis culicivorax TaxID=13658 RepID=A0A915IK03_ROMCU